MKDLEMVKKDCHEKLMGLKPELWTRSHFTFFPKSDMLMNNISEAFNGRILEARDKPILTMMEWIRCYWLSKFSEKRSKAESYKGKICPKPKKRLDGEVVQSRYWAARWVGEMNFEVSNSSRHIAEKFVVDLQAGSCTCRFWGLTGMPCRHACGAIFFKGDDPEDYCCHYYTAQSYKACYEPVVKLINGENMWPTLNQQMLSSTYRAKPGRPKRLRRREPDEPSHPHKYRRSGGSLKCGTCNMYGHNARHYTRNEVSQSAAADPLTVDLIATQTPFHAPQFATTTTRGRGRGRGRAWRRRGGRGRQAIPETPIRVPAPKSQPRTPTSTAGRRREGRGTEVTTTTPKTPIKVRAPRSQPGTPTSPAGRGRGWRRRRATATTAAADPDPIGQPQILSQPAPSIATGSRSPIHEPSDPELYSLPGFKLRAVSLGSFGTLFYKEQSFRTTRCGQ